MAKPVSERELVLFILLEVLEKGRYSHIVLREVLEKYQYLDKKERSFITRVTEGTLEHLLEIDYILNQFSKVPTGKMKPVIRNILRSGVYQLKYMDTVPNAAVCDEAVKLAKKKGFGSLRGFVNGVLRGTARGMDTVSYPNDPVENLSVKYSMPGWILELWLSVYKKEIVEKMLADFQKEKPLTVRCSLKGAFSRKQKEERAEILRRRLEAEGVKVQSHPYLPYAFWISGYDYLRDLQSFREGMFTVQDVSSMLVCEAAAPKPGDFVIDVCASPGGKSLHMAEVLAGSGKVEARDLTEYKTGLLEENIARSGLTNIQAVNRDARVPDSASVKKADIVLADLPCSGLGVLGKKTDLKYKASQEGAAQLVCLQREILSVVQTYVKPGGILVYSTCTINPAENQENARWFLKRYPEFSFCDIREKLCEELRPDVEEKGMLQLLPGIHKSDGFFLACFRNRDL